MQLEHWLIIGSILIFIASVALLPAVLILIPSNYFVRDARQASPLRHRPLLRLGFLLIKNIAGLVLFSAGLVMLFTPGQGLIGMLAGLWLMDFPGKHAFERRIVARPGILRALNVARRRFGRPPFERPHK